MRTIRLEPARVRLLGFAFLCGFLGTLGVHAYGLLNHINISDQVRNVFAIPATVTLGRWLLSPALEIGTRLSMPWFNGLMLALAVGLTAAVLCELFGFTGRLPALLSALALATFPTLTESILYIHVVDAYGYAMLLAALGALLADRYRWGFLPAAACLTLSLGIYQAYLPLAIGWLAIRGLLHLLDGRRDGKALLLLAMRYGLAVLLALGAYLVVNRIVLASTGAALSDYMGVSAMGNVQLKNLGHLLKNAYLGFFDYYFTATLSYHGVLALAFNALVLAFDVGAALYLLLRRKRSVPVILCALGMLALLPLLFDTVYLFNSEYVHRLMVFSLACPYWLAVALGAALAGEEGGGARSLTLRRGSAALAACALLGLYFGYTVYANQVYYILNLDYEATSQYASRVLYRLESSEDFTPDTPVLFVGRAANSGYGSVAFYKQIYARFADQSPFSVMQSDSHVRGFLRSYLGVQLASPDEATAARLQVSDAVAAMPAYPAQGAVQAVDGVLVVKLGDP